MATLQLKKQASNAHDGNDIPFEQAFSNIAHAYLQDAAPALLEHEIGFQLLDRTDDNKRAVAVLGFKLGSQTLYAPVFFLNGQLKGNELLYLKNEDAFIPLSEKWVLYLMNKRPAILGEGISRNNAQTGVTWPSLSQLTRESTKYGSADEPWYAGFLPVYAGMMERGKEILASPRYAGYTLPEMMKRASPSLTKRLLHTVLAYPWLSEKLAQWHGENFLDDLVKSQQGKPDAVVVKQAARLDVPITHPVKTGALKVVTYASIESSILSPDLTEAEVERLSHDGVVIRDTRDPDDEESVSRAYNIETSWRLFNPSEPGLYDVLKSDGNTVKCVVLAYPANNKGRTSVYLVVPTDGKKTCIAAHPSRIWVSKQYDQKEWDSYIEGLSSVTSLDTEYSERILVGECGDCCQPFRVVRRVGDNSGYETFTVRLSYASRESMSHTNDRLPGPYDRDEKNWESGECSLRVLPTSHGKIRSDGNMIVAPNNSKIIVCGETRERPSYMDVDDCCDEDFQLGNQDDVKLLLHKKTAALKIWSDSREYQLNSHRTDQVGALSHLVLKYGLTEKAAREMLTSVTVSGRNNGGAGSQQYCVKLAYPFQEESRMSAPEFPAPDTQSGSFMGGATPEMSSQQQLLQVNGGATSEADRQRYAIGPLDNQTMQSVERAAQSGQKEVFDTAVMTGLLQSSHLDSDIEEALDALMPGLDKLGRLLFLLYWHGDEFADRYGKEDLREFEDGLRDAFDKVGDIIIFAKTREIEADPQAARLKLKIGDN